MSKTLTRIKINAILLEKSLLVLIVIFLSYGSILPYSSKVFTYSLILLVSIQLLIVFTTKQENYVLSQSPLFFWMVFYLFVIINRGPIVYTMKLVSWALDIFCIFIFLLLNTRRNVDTLYFFIKTVSYVEILHAVVTIIFWIFPNIYPIFKNTFYSNVLRIVGEGYRSGLTTHYSTNGMLLSLGVLSSFALLERGEKKDKVLFVIYLFSLVLTTKRAHLIFSVASCFFVFFLSNRKKTISQWSKYIGIFLIVVFLCYIVIILIPDLGITFSRLQDIDDTTRFAYWDICIQLFEKSPLVGNGWYAFTDYLYGTYLGDEKAAWGNTTQNAHNSYFQVLAEEGIIGELLFLLAIIVTLIFSIRIFDSMLSKSIDKNDKSKLISIRYSILMQIFFILYSLTGGVLYVRLIYVPYFMSFGAINYSLRRIQHSVEIKYDIA